ncbi:MAG: cobalamin B12-binding domain-containing protein [Deltaproteobacteria bacterium]|nr:cobalamin B12-binding domain-containing protein [Deltaproteobacteria bacterium]
MANGLLVSYAGSPYAFSSLFPDNGLASLAAVLRAEGHECVVWDLNTAETMARTVPPETRRALGDLLPRLAGAPAPAPADLERLVALSRRVDAQGSPVADDLAARLVDHCRSRRVDFVGFKLWNGDGYEGSLRLAARLRAACPGVRLFAGGPAVHYCSDIVQSDAPLFDAVVDGDGEEAILELARYVEGRRPLGGVPNLVRGARATAPAGSSCDLSTLPLPEYGPEVYPAIARGEKIRLFCIDESRGCPMGCAFCINRCIEGTKWRTRTPDQVVTEIRALRSHFGTRAFRLAGTYSPPELLTGICERLIAQELDIQFGAFLHAGAVDEALVSSLKAAGCFGLFVGAESGSTAILKRAMHKSLSGEALRHALDACLRAGLFVAASFIFPAPFETAATESETKRLLLEVFGPHAQAAVNVGFPGLVPRTRWWTERDRYGFALDVDDDAYRRLILRYKIRHLLPPSLWPELPYTLGGQRQADLAQRSGALQRWVRDQGIGINLADHDAQVGAALGQPARDFGDRLRRLFVTGDAEGLQALVDESNRALSCPAGA